MNDPLTGGAATPVLSPAPAGSVAAGGSDAVGDPARHQLAGPGRWWVTLLWFIAVAVVVWVVVWLSAAYLPRTDLYPRGSGGPGGAWFEGWARWDAYWYRAIVEDGYSYYPGVQSAVAYFPTYPAVLWAVSGLFPSVFVAGSVVTLVSGAVAVVTFRRWAGLFLARRGATTAAALLVLYPFSWYLFGAIYADALFLAVAIGAFLALERDRLWLVALLGTVATVSRPTGIAVALGLVLRLLEIRNADARSWRSRLDPRSLRRRDYLVFTSFAGIVGWVIYLGVQFGDPFAFSSVQAARGWDQPASPSTWLKFSFFRNLSATQLNDSYSISLLLQAALAVVALALIVVVWRRLGWGYAGYCMVVVAMPLVGSKDFMGIGRYLLPAFPVFAMAGALLAGRPKTRMAVLGASGVTLLVLASFFARGYYLA